MRAQERGVEPLHYITRYSGEDHSHQAVQDDPVTREDHLVLNQNHGNLASDCDHFFQLVLAVLFRLLRGLAHVVRRKNRVAFKHRIRFMAGPLFRDLCPRIRHGFPFAVLPAVSRLPPFGRRR